MVRLGQPCRRCAGLSGWRDRVVCHRACPCYLRRLVLSKNETAAHHHMKMLLSILAMRSRAVAWCVGGSMLLVAQRASACPFCYGAKDGKATEHMAVAIWFLFGAVMSVIGG